MKSGKIAVFGLILAAAMGSAAAARAEISIGGGIEGYMPSAKPYVIVLPAARPEAAAAPAKAVQPAPAAGVAAATVSAVNETEAKVSVAQVAKAGKKARSPRRKSRIAGGVPAAPKTAAPVSVS